jgi:hypothetical protein
MYHLEMPSSRTYFPKALECLVVRRSCVWAELANYLATLTRLSVGRRSTLYTAHKSLNDSMVQQELSSMMALRSRRSSVPAISAKLVEEEK